MGLSFGDSLKKVNEENKLDEVKIESDVNVETKNNVAMPMMAASYNAPSVTTYPNGLDDEWIVSEKYLTYSEYADTNISSIDVNKNIVLNPKQQSITQESNSQYIPFEMPRYYDGFDLMNTTILVHFVNKSGFENNASPVNVSYNVDKIKFAWIVDKNVTAVEGIVKFEIQAVGINSKGDEYCWKSRPSEELVVLESLSGNGIIEPDDSWITSFMTQMTEKVSDAYFAAQQSASSAEASFSSASDAKASADRAQGVVDGAKEELADSVQAAVNTKVDTALLGYYTKTEVDDIVANIDISDQLDDIQSQIDNLDGLAEFKVEYDGSTMTFYNGTTVIKTITIPSAEYIASVNSRLGAIDTDLTGIHTEIDGLPETLATDYYNKTDADAKFATKISLGATNDSISVVDAKAETNKQNVATLGTKVSDVETIVNGIDKSPRLTYDATYGEDSIYTLWEIEGEGAGAEEVRTAKSQFKIQGGGGGGSTSSTLKIEYITTTPIVATVSDDVVIKYNFSGTDSSGDAVMEGTAVWRVAGAVVATNTAMSGENSFDITKYVTIGTQKVNLAITDDAGSLVTKTWTVQKVDVRIESSFNDKLTYPIDGVAFDYIPYGAVDKTVHFKIDGEEVGTADTSVSGIPMAYELPQQTHGAHLLEVYMTANINNNTIESNHIIKDIIWYDVNSEIPVIGCTQQSFTARQYDATNIAYTVYDPTTETPTVKLAVDGEVVSTLTLDGNTQTWQYKETTVGTHTLTISCGQTTKTLVATIEKLDIELDPVTAGLVFDFNPIGKSNNDADRIWSSGDVAMSVSNNFDWINGGYQIDDNGDQYFCVKAGTTASINYKLFEDDAKRNGKELKLVFKTTNVRDVKTTFLTCLDGSDAAKIGVEMNVHEAYIHAGAGSLYLPYSEDDVIEFEFNINKNTDDIPMIMGYEDGVATRPMVYSDSHDFTQVNAKDILIGSEDCDVFIYRFKVYNTALTDRGILNNFIADARNAEVMVSRYARNQIYDENSQLTPEILAEKCPQLRIIKIDAPHFTNNKSDKVSGTTIQCIYKDGDPILDNWVASNSMHSGQGTTSNEYGAAGRNLDLIMNKSGIDGVTPSITLGDGTTQTDKISLTRDSVDVNYLNVKVNIASCENANNALLQKRYNDYNPFVRTAKVNNPKVKDTMEFFNCVVFVRENDTDISTHREFDDCEYHFYSIGNVGDSKKTDKTRLNDAADKLECIVEIMDNTLPNSTFPGDAEGLANLERDPFDESMTYGWRYSYDDEDPTVTQPCIDKWKEFYKFAVTSTDEEFKANLKDYFVVDSALYFYLFTTRYTMIDNRAKNTFFHLGKCEDGIYRWDLAFNYDNDKKKCRCKTFSYMRRKPRGGQRLGNIICLLKFYIRYFNRKEVEIWHLKKLKKMIVLRNGL